jgi:hypothetical protein
MTGMTGAKHPALVAWLGQESVSTVIADIHPDHHASSAVAAAGLTPTTAGMMERSGGG